MLMWVQLFVMLLAILLASMIFTNALEHLGDRLGISTGVTGSIFAAVGTALPETIVPVMAIFAGTANVAANHDIGVGAILGAPLMLSTLAMFVMAVAAAGKRGWRGFITPERSGLVRDLHFFLVAYVLAGIALFVPDSCRTVRLIIGMVLLIWYGCYLVLTMRASRQLVKAGHAVQTDEPLYLSWLGCRVSRVTIAFQMLIGLVLLVMSAEGFIFAVEGVAEALQFPVLVLSLLIIPVATELPEKVNSVLWIRKRKDTLAVGNLSGAMVFQGTVLPALGIMMTPWAGSPAVVTGLLITLAAAIWLRLMAWRQGWALWALIINGALYGLYLILIFI